MNNGAADMNECVIIESSKSENGEEEKWNYDYCAIF